MSASANHFKLGLFVLTAAVLLVAGVVVLGVGALFTKTIPMETYVDESVQGLEVGAAVKHRGVKIGKVTRIDFVANKYEVRATNQYVDYGSYVLVEAALEPDAFGAESMSQLRARVGQMVEGGLRIHMAFSGLTGAAYLEVAFLDPEENPPPDITWVPNELYIPAAVSTFGRLVSATEEILAEIRKANISGLASNLDQLLVATTKAVEGANISEVRQEAVGLLKELRASNDRLRAILASPHIDTTLESAAATLTSTNRILNGSEQDLAAFAGELPRLTRSLREASDRLEALLASEQTAQTMTGLADSAAQLPETVAQLQQTLRQIEDLVANERADVQAIIANLRVISEHLTTLSSRAKDYPAHLLFGDPPEPRAPGEVP